MKVGPGLVFIIAVTPELYSSTIGSALRGSGTSEYRSGCHSNLGDSVSPLTPNRSPQVNPLLPTYLLIDSYGTGISFAMSSFVGT